MIFPSWHNHFWSLTWISLSISFSRFDFGGSWVWVSWTRTRYLNVPRKLSKLDHYTLKEKEFQIAETMEFERKTNEKGGWKFQRKIKGERVKKAKGNIKYIGILLRIHIVELEISRENILFQENVFCESRNWHVFVFAGDLRKRGKTSCTCMNSFVE